MIAVLASHREIAHTSTDTAACPLHPDGLRSMPCGMVTACRRKASLRGLLPRVETVALLQDGT